MSAPSPVTMAGLAPAWVSPELEAGVLSALRIPRRPSLYLTLACSPANAGCLLVIDGDGPHPCGQVLGLAIPVPGGGWLLGCCRCHGPVTWDATGRGRCSECASDRNGVTP